MPSRRNRGTGIAGSGSSPASGSIATSSCGSGSEARTIRSTLTLHPDADGHEGTFALTIVPPTSPGAGPARPRDVVFVLDRSGSMEGWKMVAARRAVARMIDTLGDADRFCVLAFDSSVEMPASCAGGTLGRGGS